MYNRLDNVVARFEEITEALSTPEIASDPTRSMKLMRERADLEDTVGAWVALKRTRAELHEANGILREEDDPDMRAMARDEIATLESEVERLDEVLRDLMVPRDPRDKRDVVLEIRAGTGGEEAALFAGDLLRMYTRFAEDRGFQIEPVSMSDAAQGGIKEVVVLIKGRGAFSLFKHESGTHRVQRVPATESQGRIHTSACTVAVLPQAEETDLEIHTKDLRVDTYRASGAGGQHVNKTDSAVRITHLPTGVVVQCQDERSQHKNRARAMMLLRSKLLDAQQRARHTVESDSRREQVGSGDRSERIRTYNFPQNRITDHRINLTIYALDRVVAGELGPVIEPLQAAERADKLAAAQA